MHLLHSKHCEASGGWRGVEAEDKWARAERDIQESGGVRAELEAGGEDRARGKAAGGRGGGDMGGPRSP